MNLAKQEIRKQSQLTVDLLRQSSDDLTRLCRTYVITEMKIRKHIEYLDVRNGKAIPEKTIIGFYWDLLTGNESEFHRDENVRS
jgi:methyl-accepting chemotaxis protein